MSLEGSNFDFTSMKGALFDNVIFYWVSFLSNNFISCKFKNIIFAGTIFENVVFKNCSFHNVIFRPGNLGGGCVLTETVFENCTFSRCSSINSEIDDESFLPHNMVMKTIDPKDLDLVSGPPISKGSKENISWIDYPYGCILRMWLSRIGIISRSNSLIWPSLSIFLRAVRQDFSDE